MLRLLLILNLIIHFVVVSNSSVEPDSASAEMGDLGKQLADLLKNNKENDDLSNDEEYEDLRAEFLAYRAALDSLVPSSRRSLITTPCWKLNGICINYMLCQGYKYLTEVPGCKNKLKVCCFIWDQYGVRDQMEHGLENAAFPWNHPKEIGGKGPMPVTPIPELIRKPTRNKSKLKNETAVLVFL